MKRTFRSLACALLALTAIPVQTNKAIGWLKGTGIGLGVFGTVIGLGATTVRAKLHRKFRQKSQPPAGIKIDESKQNDTAPRWDWRNYKSHDLNLREVASEDFLKMASTAAHQVEGNQNNNWIEWENKEDTVCHQPSDKACRLWDEDGNFVEKNFQEFVDKLQELGMNAYRFSLEWSRFQPNGPYEWEEKAVSGYARMFKMLSEKNIKAVVSLHHFTNPMWFQNLGGFTKEENIKHFVNFCSHAYSQFGDDVHIWFTINEPVGHAFLGYKVDKSLGQTRFPHACQDNECGLQMTGRVYFNLLKAHVRAYHALHAMAESAGTKIIVGIGKNFCQMRPDSLSFGDMFGTAAAEKLSHDSFVNFFKTGRFTFCLPVIGGLGWLLPFSFLRQKAFPYINEVVPEAKGAFDVIGMNYYAHRYIKGFGAQAHKDYEIETDMDRYRICPEGFYYAIVEAAQFGKPILINECGLADDGKKLFDLPEDHQWCHLVNGNVAETGDWRRDLFYKLYYKSLYEAMKTLREKDTGAKVIGLGHWSLVDNFEWDEGYAKEFGLCSYDLDASGSLTLKIKPGAKYTQEVMNSF